MNKNFEQKKIVLQKGVELLGINEDNLIDEMMFYGDCYEDADEALINEYTECYQNKCYYINVDSEITSITFGGFNYFNLKSNENVFPNVTEIVLNEDVKDIFISNAMFPNVRKVTSKSPYYLSGDCLVRIPEPIVDMIISNEVTKEYVIESKQGILQNTFVKNKEDKIDLKYIHDISSYAFTNCESSNIINTESVVFCYKDAFFDFKGILPKENEDFIIGTILVTPNIDNEKEVYEFPDKTITAIQDDMPFLPTKIKKVVVKTAKQGLALIHCYLHIDEFVFDSIDEFDFSLLEHDKFNSKMCCNKIQITEKNPYYKSIDNIIYSKDGKSLIKYITFPRNAFLNEKVLRIQEGVEKINQDAFSFAPMIEKIQLPETLKCLKNGTFNNCSSLIIIYIPESLEYIEPDCFSSYFKAKGSVRLKSKKMPKNLINALTYISDDEYRHNKKYTKIPYVAIHLIDKNEDPLKTATDCNILNRLYVSYNMNYSRNYPGILSEMNKYYNSNQLDNKYNENTWKFVSLFNHSLQLNLALKVVLHMNDNNKDVNEYIKNNELYYLHMYIDLLSRRYNNKKGRRSVINSIIKFIDLDLFSEESKAEINDYISDIMLIANKLSNKN